MPNPASQPNTTSTNRSNPVVFLIPPLLIIIVALIIYIASSDSGTVNQPTTIKNTISSGNTLTPTTPKDVTSTRRIAENDLAFTVGPKDAKVTVVEFLDFQCPFCKQTATTIDELINEYRGKSVRFMFRHYPLVSIHPHALITAQGAVCAREQNAFLPMHDYLYKNQDTIGPQLPYTAAKELNLDVQKFTTCMSSEKSKSALTKDVTDALDLNIQGTPTFFINGQKLAGVVEKEIFKTAIDGELTRLNKK